MVIAHIALVIGDNPDHILYTHGSITTGELDEIRTDLFVVTTALVLKIVGTGRNISSVVRPRSSIERLTVLSAPLASGQGWGHSAGPTRIAVTYRGLIEEVLPPVDGSTLHQSTAVAALLPTLLGDLEASPGPRSTFGS